MWQKETYILLRYNEVSGNAVVIRLPANFDWHEENFNPYADVMIEDRE